MPQATTELRERWYSDSAARTHLQPNFTFGNDGYIRPKPGYRPTRTDRTAIDFLFQEYDYGYEPLPAGHA